jgi:hypothetical protein
MLELAGLGHNQTIPYDKAVAEGKAIVGRLEGNCWRLADLANQIEPKYGADTIGQFANAIGMNPGTITTYRSIARAWPESSRRLSFSVSQALVSLPPSDREMVIHENPLITIRDARKLVKEYRAKLNGDEDDDENDDEDSSHRMDGCDAPTDDDSMEDRWRYNFSNMAQLSIELRAHWEKHFKNWDFLNITTEEVKLAEDAAREWRSIAKTLRGMKNG